jgi:hypothetical protein
MFTASSIEIFSSEYLEMQPFQLGVDIGSSTVARGVVSLVLGYLNNLVIEMAFLVQVIVVAYLTTFVTFFPLFQLSQIRMYLYRKASLFDSRLRMDMIISILFFLSSCRATRKKSSQNSF